MPPLRMVWLPPPPSTAPLATPPEDTSTEPLPETTVPLAVPPANTS